MFEFENCKKGLAGQTCTLYMKGYIDGGMDRGKIIFPWILNVVAYRKKDFYSLYVIM